MLAPGLCCAQNITLYDDGCLLCCANMIILYSGCFAVHSLSHCIERLLVWFTYASHTYWSMARVAHRHCTYKVDLFWLWTVFDGFCLLVQEERRVAMFLSWLQDCHRKYMPLFSYFILFLVVGEINKKMLQLH